MLPEFGTLTVRNPGNGRIYQGPAAILGPGMAWPEVFRTEALFCPYPALPSISASLKLSPI